MLGVTATGTRTLSRLVSAAAAVPHAHPETVAVSAAVILVMLVARRIVRRLPGALIAVIGEIIVGRAADLARHGVAVIGPVPRGLPPLGLPALSLHDATGLLGAAASMFVVILAQSAATSRVYAAKHGETFSPQSDLLGLGAANVAAAFSGTFVVNGSPTQTQVADSAGARGQLAQLTTSAVVVLVLLFATGLAYLPVAALAAVVFLIGVQLIDVSGMRRILSVRRNEFIIALLTAAAVVFLGVQEGIVLAVVASIIDHLRHTYHPRNSVLVKSPAGHWHATPVRPGARTEKRLAVYRFSTDLYYANAARLQEDVTALTGHGEPLLWLVLDGAAIGDVHYTAALVLTEVIEELRERHIRFVVTSIIGPVRRQLDRYGISAAMGHDAYYTPGCSAGGIPRRPPARPQARRMQRNQGMPRRAETKTVELGGTRRRGQEGSDGPHNPCTGSAGAPERPRCAAGRWHAHARSGDTATISGYRGPTLGPSSSRGCQKTSDGRGSHGWPYPSGERGPAVVTQG